MGTYGSFCRRAATMAEKCTIGQLQCESNEIGGNLVVAAATRAKDGPRPSLYEFPDFEISKQKLAFVITCADLMDKAMRAGNKSMNCDGTFRFSQSALEETTGT